MKLLKVSTDLEVTVHDFPGGSYEQQNEFIRELIGNDCRVYEHIMPRRLYTKLDIVDHPTHTAGQCVSMLIDEEGSLKENKPNLIGSYLYGTDLHGHPIVGNVLFVGEVWRKDDLNFCGIEDSVLCYLYKRLNDMIKFAKHHEGGGWK